MILSHILLVIGVVILSLGLRTFSNPFIHRLGSLGILAASFLAGWLFSGNVLVGVLLALSWFLLPWLEILTRIRTMRLPMERKLTPRPPPSRNAFPGLSELTDEVEEQSFEHIADSGWDWEEYRQFFRIFHRADEKLQASICLIEQSDLAFYYLIVSCRDTDGNVWMTWNYPFSYGLKFLPKLKMNRLAGDLNFEELLESHRSFLNSRGITQAQLLSLTPEEIQEDIQSDLKDQILHNIHLGLLKPEGENLIRYSVRGMFFLWFQFLRDLVRLS